MLRPLNSVVKLNFCQTWFTQTKGASRKGQTCKISLSLRKFQQQQKQRKKSQENNKPLNTPLQRNSLFVCACEYVSVCVCLCKTMYDYINIT